MRDKNRTLHAAMLLLDRGEAPPASLNRVGLRRVSWVSTTRSAEQTSGTVLGHGAATEKVRFNWFSARKRLLLAASLAAAALLIFTAVWFGPQSSNSQIPQATKIAKPANDCSNSALLRGLQDKSLAFAAERVIDFGGTKQISGHLECAGQVIAVTVHEAKTASGWKKVGVAPN